MPGLPLAHFPNQRIKFQASTQLLPVKTARLAATATPFLKAEKQDKKLAVKARLKAFPIAWFIILTLLIAGLIALFVKFTESQSPPVGVIFLLPLIPLAIIWLIIVIKALALWLAPMLGWPVFWTVLALILAFYILANLLTLGISALVDLIRNISYKHRVKRYMKKKKAAESGN